METLLEPVRALGRAAVGEGVRGHVSPGLPLHPVIADSAGRIEGFLDVALLEDVAGLVGVVSPDTGKTVRLQLHHDRKLVGLCLARPAAERMDLLGNPQEVLDMMPHLVGDDIGLGEIPRRAKPVFEVAVEAEVNVNFVVTRAVKGPTAAEAYPQADSTAPVNNTKVGSL